MTSLDTRDQTDRILLGVCAGLWLAALGSSAAAVVALVDLGSPHGTTSDHGTPWLLYSVIGVSALVIAGAIPLLIRARRTALGSAAGAPGERRGPPQTVFGPPLGTEGRTRVLQGPAIRRQSMAAASSRVGFPTAAVDQVWERCAVALAGAIGGATAAVGIATYLMASQHDGVAWGVFVVAGLVTAGMPVIPWFALKQLHELLDQR